MTINAANSINRIVHWSMLGYRNAARCPERQQMRKSLARVKYCRQDRLWAGLDIATVAALAKSPRATAKIKVGSKRKVRF